MPTQAAVDRQTYPLVFQVDRYSYRSQTKSLCDLIDLDVPVCAAPSDVDQTRYASSLRSSPSDGYNIQRFFVIRIEPLSGV